MNEFNQEDKNDIKKGLTDLYFWASMKFEDIPKTEKEKMQFAFKQLLEKLQ